MRAIKFRAWDDSFADVSKHHMHYFKLGDEDAGYYEQRGPVMQYTGLLDKNGVEIYEGDVVKIDYKDDEDGDFETTAQVDWCEGYWSIIEYPDEPKYLEVIGNVHETPELLP